VVGHSNGSAFTSLLLHERGDAIAATANLSAQPGRLLLTDPVRSMFMAMGEQDPIVSFANQRRSIPLAEQHLGVDPTTAEVDGLLRTARGTDGVELATYVYPGGHAPPPEVAPLIVDFLRRQSLP
jgi:pimeloyl-ACP methyl ester carboxylesterase